MMKKTIRNIQGDTIVEVLIAIAVVSLVLATAYASSNRSLQTNRRAQERGEAMRVAEEQIERLKASAAQSGSIFAGWIDFCMNASLTKTDINPQPPGTLNNDTFANYPDDCRTTLSGGAYNYHSWIRRTIPDPNIFRIRVRWDALGGEKQQVEISYKVYSDD